MGKLLKTMSVPQLISLAAKLAARKGRREVKVLIRPPYLPPLKCPRRVESPFGVVSVYIKPAPNEKGEWEVFVRFPSLSNPVIPKEEGEALLKKL